MVSGQEGTAVMRRSSTMGSQRGQAVIADPPIAHYLFANTHLAWLWLLARLWLGWAWLESGLGKIVDAGWVGGGAAVKGFWERALQTSPSGKPVIAVDWYRSFIQALYDAQAWTWLAPVIAWSEVICGVALLVGLLAMMPCLGRARSDRALASVGYPWPSDFCATRFTASVGCLLCGGGCSTLGPPRQCSGRCDEAVTADAERTVCTRVKSLCWRSPAR